MRDTELALDRQVFSATPILLFLLHVALGDVWNNQFFLKERPLTGVYVIFSFWLILIAATMSVAAASPLAAAMIAPTIAWVLVAACLNLDVWWLNRDR